MKKILFLFVAGMLFQNHCCAQKKGKLLVDSLLIGLSGMKEDTTKVTRYFDIMSAYVNYKPSEGLAYQAAALELAKKTGWIIGLAKIKDRIGRLHWRMGNFSEALKNHTEALEVYQESNNGYSRYILVEIGQDYVDDGKYAEAEMYLLKAVKLCIANNDKRHLSSAYDVLRYMYGLQGNMADATKIGYAYLKVLEEIGASQMQIESDKKAASIKAEQEKKDLLTQAELRRQQNLRNVAFGVLLLVFVFSVVVFRQRNKIAKEKRKSDQLLVDKELLLREIHHRVKNNLEVVSSLLALQSAQIDDPNTKEAMLEGQNRVHSIGIVHQKLYQGTNLGAIEMKDYFINLSKSILDSFGAEKRVTIKCVMDHLDVDIDTAVPLGLIVNELLTNTLKYAFPAGQHGNVQIKLHKQVDGMLQLEVSDDGVGKSGLIHGTGFGGQLVALLTQQLGGTIREEVKEGTHIYFEFKPLKAA